MISVGSTVKYVYPSDARKRKGLLGTVIKTSGNGSVVEWSDGREFIHLNSRLIVVAAEPKRSKYAREVKGVTVDVYDVLKAFNVTCPALQHAAKKVLCAGLRGHKDTEKDIREAIEALERAEQLHAE